MHRCYHHHRRNNNNFNRRYQNQESSFTKAFPGQLDNVSSSFTSADEEDKEEEERRRQRGSNSDNNNNKSACTTTTSSAAVGKRETMMVFLTTTLLSGFSTVNSPEAVLARENNVVVEASTSATSGTIKGSVILPSGYHMTRGARSRIQTTSSRPDVVKITNGEKDLGNALQFEVGYANAKAEDEVTVNALVYFCQDDDVCLSRTVSFRAKVVDGGGDSSSSSSVVDLTYSIPTPEPEISFAVPQFE